MKYLIFLFSILLITQISCTKDDSSINQNAQEDFDSLTRPYFAYNIDKNQYILEPWNYNLAQNSNRNYPLVIFLHGSGGAGNISYLNYIGYDNPDDDRDDQVALEFQQNHPCFTLVPQTSSSWDNSSLIEQVEYFKENYRIDTNRIYLIGYSMGGSGSYSFANSYNVYNQHLFAGIIRLAGQSQISVRDAIAENTGIWLHIGLEDTEQRVQVTRDAFDFLKAYHPNAVETTSAVPIEGYTGLSYSLTLNNKKQFIRTEYEGVGHGVAAFPFKDPYLIEWLFALNL
jgi:predicted peptidase